MPTQNITIRLDTELKKEAEKLFSDLGMNMTTAFNIFLKQAVREQQLPFIVSNIPNKLTIKAIKDARNGIALSRPFNSVEELMEDLNADD